MNTRETQMIDIHDPRISGDQAYLRALSRFGKRPGRSLIKLAGFLALACGVAATQSVIADHTTTLGPSSGTQAMIALFYLMGVIGVGLWIVDSVRKHPHVYASVLKAVGMLLVLGYVAHRIRKATVNLIADGVVEAESRDHHHR